ncbi:hypothetical protein [Halobacillus litoralis]|uniref:Uncharacterized protein n=1 Tax=Halobacillus litoralis TaxID=45668 RepID=A0A410MCE4_9BACI|nr:hypothetical protein [Halobacillus litoralis]QAS52412.1 hypothetical protein HLI_09280 [Halobacillus litoralis]
MNYAEELRKPDELGIGLDANYIILCKMVAQYGDHDDLIELTNEYQNLKGSAGIAKPKTKCTVA